MDKGMMEYYLYRFKQWLGSVSRELQNRELEDIPYDGDNGNYWVKLGHEVFMKEPLIFNDNCDFITKDNENGIEYDYCIQCYRYEICKKAYKLSHLAH